MGLIYNMVYDNNIINIETERKEQKVTMDNVDWQDTWYD